MKGSCQGAIPESALRPRKKVETLWPWDFILFGRCCGFSSSGGAEFKTNSVPHPRGICQELHWKFLYTA